MHRPLHAFASRHMIKVLGQIDFAVLAELGLKQNDVVTEGSAMEAVCDILCYMKAI